MNHRQEISLEVRKLVIFHRNKGKTYRKIGEILKLSFSTVRNIINRHLYEDRVENAARSGRPKVLGATEKKFILREIRTNPRISAPKLVSLVQENFGKSASAETIRRILRSENYNGRLCRKKPFVSEVNRIKRLKFAKSYVSRPLESWKNVIFVDESKFNLFGNDGRPRVWRKPNTALDKKHLCATIKHGGGSVMVWACMSYHGVGNLVFIQGNMNKMIYLNILRENLHQSGEKMGIRNCFEFYQDNDPKHKAYEVRSWLLYNCPKVVDTPAQSPDLNPIENLWDYVDRKVRLHDITSISMLKEVLAREWNAIGKDVCAKYVSSMPKRMSLVINRKGNPIEY